MKNRKEFLEEYLGEDKIPLTHNTFTRKDEVGEILKRKREESRLKASENLGKRIMVHRNVLLYGGIAAMFVVILGISVYFISDHKIFAGDVPMEYELPDGSLVQVMEHSSFTYNRITWVGKRKLRLSGKAFFSVTPGETFTVQTEAGDVTVLGTQFLVDQHDKQMTVNCKEGSVRVKTSVGEQTLVAGENIHCDENVMEPIQKEAEFREILTYENDPLINVAADIEQIFNVKIVNKEICEGFNYTGMIYTRKLKETLNKVFGYCKISYQLNEKEVVLQ